MDSTKVTWEIQILYTLTTNLGPRFCHMRVMKSQLISPEILLELENFSLRMKTRLKLMTPYRLQEKHSVLSYSIRISNLTISFSVPMMTQSKLQFLEAI